MSMYASPEALAANPPETWEVRKRGERSWGLWIEPTNPYPTQTFKTRREALAERDDATSYTRRMVEKERRWYAGEQVDNWKSWAECKAEQERIRASQAKRRAEAAA
ncbi:hypothetical protein J2X12_002866 [Pseudarthrobacter oxydans]|uniref:Uncharacterized protein n=1 Tax=Pseudarthrobacter oxydans TaxID=1671 RepID=A0AAW8NFK8_PSEOX|nr:hypothetical protein [Pseudarthrobacter oxydans]MDR6794397.1 hypothetical protein [Pseudarthrobacter oxydans]MDR7164828.1 hypothetical protein [Pseudarthrobacter oxydans]